MHSSEFRISLDPKPFIKEVALRPQSYYSKKSGLLRIAKIIIKQGGKKHD